MALIHDRGRGPEIVDTRITVYTIVHYLEGGRLTSTELARLLGLTDEQMAAALSYIDEHRDEVMAEHRRIEERIARGNSPEIQAKANESHRKFQELLRQRAARLSGAADARIAQG